VRLELHPNPPRFLKEPEELRRHVPEPSARITAKIRPGIEGTASAWVRAARLVGLTTRRPDGLVDVGARARPQGLARPLGAHEIRISDLADARIGEAATNLASNAFAGALFVLPGIPSTLRINGRAHATAADDEISLDVREAYVHCPKAFVRSKLWRTADRTAALDALEAESGPALGPHASRFLARAPFAMLGTCLPDGGGDVSPRGDPPGFVHQLDERTLVLPDRPGNRILDSFRNLLANPVAGLLLLVPGSSWTLRVTGEARVIDDPGWLAPLAVQGKRPQLGIWIRVHESVLEPAPALAAARIWEPSAHVSPRDVPSPGRSLVEQIEPTGRFRAAKGRLVDWMLDRDAKTNLY